MVIDLEACKWRTGRRRTGDVTYSMKTFKSLSVSLAGLSTLVKRLSEDGIVVWGLTDRCAETQKILHDLLGDDGGEVKGEGVVVLVVLGRVRIALGLHLGH